MKKSFTYAPKPFKKMPKGTKELPVANAVYIPNTDKNGKKISSKEFKKRINETELFLLNIFGGYTTDELEHGEFISKLKKKVISERIARVLSFSEVGKFKKHRVELEKWLIKKKKEWNQETIAYEFEGDLFYI